MLGGDHFHCSAGCLFLGLSLARGSLVDMDVGRVAGGVPADMDVGRLPVETDGALDAAEMEIRGMSEGI